MKDDQKSHKRKEDESSDLRPAKAPKLDEVDDSTIIQRVHEALRERTAVSSFSYVTSLVHVFIDSVQTGKEECENVPLKPESSANDVPKKPKETVDPNYEELSVMRKSFFELIQKKAVSMYKEKKRTVGYDVKDICGQIVSWIMTFFESQCADQKFKNFVLFAKAEWEIQREKALFEKNLHKGNNYLAVSVATNTNGECLSVGYNHLQREKKAQNNEEVMQLCRDSMPEQRMRYYLYDSPKQERHKKVSLTKQQYDDHPNKDNLVLKYCAEPHAALQLIEATGANALATYRFCTIQILIKKGEDTRTETGLRGPCDTCVDFINEGNSIHEDSQLVAAREAVAKAMASMDLKNTN